MAGICRTLDGGQKMVIVVLGFLIVGVGRDTATAIILTAHVPLRVILITPVFYGHIQAAGFNDPRVASYCTDFIVHMRRSLISLTNLGCSIGRMVIWWRERSRLAAGATHSARFDKFASKLCDKVAMASLGVSWSVWLAAVKDPYFSEGSSRNKITCIHNTPRHTRPYAEIISSAE